MYKVFPLFFFFIRLNEVLNMCVITFADKAQIELFEDGTFDILAISTEDVEFNTVVLLGDDTQVFNAVNNRLNGVLTP